MSGKKQSAKPVVGSETIPPPPRVNSLQAIMRLRSKKGSEWCTFAFSLNRDIVKPDGTVDDLHAVVFPLGSFQEQSQAEEHAKNIIALTGHPAVIAARYGTAVPLTTKFDPNTVEEVRVSNGRIVELETAQYKREHEEYEKRVKQDNDLVKEAEEETDPDSIEHFKRQCYLAIKNRSAYQVHTREAETAWQNYKKREMAVRDHFARHPKHEEEWLEHLKQKLTERGETNLYMGIEAAYKEIRNELLGLIESDDEDDDEFGCVGGVCKVESTVSDDEIIPADQVVKDEIIKDEIVKEDDIIDQAPKKPTVPKPKLVVPKPSVPRR